MGDECRKRKRRNRKRKVIWYNPPYNMQVKTNVGRKFIEILEDSFPNRNPLHKIFNRNSVKISYCTMSNLKSYISQHNKKLLDNDKHENPPMGIMNCSCPKNIKDDCPPGGRCLDVNIIYQAEVEKLTEIQNNTI